MAVRSTAAVRVTTIVFAAIPIGAVVRLAALINGADFAVDPLWQADVALAVEVGLAIRVTVATGLTRVGRGTNVTHRTIGLSAAYSTQASAIARSGLSQRESRALLGRTLDACGYVLSGTPIGCAGVCAAWVGAVAILLLGR